MNDSPNLFPPQAIANIMSALAAIIDLHHADGTFTIHMPFGDHVVAFPPFWPPPEYPPLVLAQRDGHLRRHYPIQSIGTTIAQ